METSTPAQQPATSGPEGSASTPNEGSAQQPLTSAQKEAIRKFKVKIDGRESEVDEAELVRGYAHSQAAHARMREAAELRKRSEPILQKFERAKRDPNALLELGKDLGVDLKNLARQMTLEEMRYELMDETERSHYDRDKKLSRYEQMEKEYEAQQTQQGIEQAKAQVATQIEETMLEYYQKELGQVPSVHLVGRAIEYMIAAKSNGQDLPIAKAHALAKRDFDKMEGETFNQKLQRMIESGELPEELVAKVRKADLDKMRQQPPQRRPGTPSEKKPSKPMNLDEWFNQRERKLK
jgi:hypothetical protein